MSRLVCLSALVLAILFSVGCDGPTGPEGPEGPPGGGSTRLVFTGTLDASGGALVELPAEAGTAEDPPAVTCYVEYGSVGWLILGSAGMGGTCTLIDRDDHLEVSITQASSNHDYKIVVMY